MAQGIDKQETSALLNEIYTDLYIIEGERGEVNQQHESRQVQQAKFNPVRQETPIKYCDIFKPPSDQHPPIKTVLTIGVAGIGKTFASMKYMLDWAEEKALKDIHYTFPLSSSPQTVLGPHEGLVQEPRTSPLTQTIAQASSS